MAPWSRALIVAFVLPLPCSRNRNLPLNSSMCDRRDENDHTAAEVFRKSARVGFGNESLTQSWSNGVFKNRNSTDPIVARGCNANDPVRFLNTVTYVFALNDPPSWESPPKGSEQDRLCPIYLPNKYVDAGAPINEPRVFQKRLTLEARAVDEEFSLCLLFYAPNSSG